MDMLKRLNDVNNIPIYGVEQQEFRSFGRILKGYDFTELIQYMDQNTSIPDQENYYIASVKEMEQTTIYQELTNTIYGGMPIQIGYCNGRNSTYNGFEYHKGSEINIVLTDCILVLGHNYDIMENSYNNDQAMVFFVKKGTAIELFQTTLHLSPIRVCDKGYRVIVVLPKGTNMPFNQNENVVKNTKDIEGRLLLHHNKWVISHPERTQLISQGAYPGIIGENIELYY